MFYKEENNAIIFDQEGELIYYVPDSWFGSKSAVINGEFISLLGAFNYAIFDENGKNSGLKSFSYPTIFLCQPSTITNEKGVRLIKTMAKDDYKLLHFKKGDKLIVNKFIPEDIGNTDELFRLFITTGHIPNTIPYNELYKYFLDNIAYSGGKYGVNAQMLGMLTTECCRDSEDLSRPFRLSKAKKNHEWNNYTNIPANQIAKHVSPFTAITSENFDEALSYAIMADPNSKSVSPLEHIFTNR